MKKILKRSLSIFLAITLIFSSAIVGLNEVDFGNLFAIEAKAVDSYGSCGFGVKWNISGDTLYITGRGAMENYSAVPSGWWPPANPKYFSAPWYEYSWRIVKVVVSPGVTNIGDYAFEKFEKLTSVEIGNDVTSIGENAFYLCKSLTSITIPDSVTEIDDSAFKYCRGLTSVTIPDSVTNIGASAFEECDMLASIDIPDSVTNIGASALYNTACYKDSSNWENGVLYIDKCLIEAENSITGDYKIKAGTKCIAGSAFKYCRGLTSITIPDSVTSISDSAFYECSGLTSITIPDSVTSIGGYVFSGCTSLTSITIPDGVTRICEGSFSGCTGLTSVTIPDSVTSIRWYAFSNCTSLTSITIPDGVTSISEYAFYNCTNIASITIPDGVTNIYSDTFYGCTSLTSITIPDGVTSIGDDAFYNCKGLKSVTIGTNVTDIYPRAFANCEGIEKLFWNAKNVKAFEGSSSIFINAGISGSGMKVVFGNDVERIPAYLFYYDDDTSIKISSITIPDSVSYIGRNAFYKTSYYEDDKNWENGVLYAGKVAIQADNSKLNSLCKIKDGTTTIASYAFYDCSNLTSITMPKGIKDIQASAFENCTNLASVVIPESIESIKGSVFSNCTKLSSIVLPDNPIEISSSAFYNTGYVNNILNNENGLIYIGKHLVKATNGVKLDDGAGGTVIYGALQENCVIKEGTLDIASYAFPSNVSLKSVTIPSSVKIIGYDAFNLYENYIAAVHISDLRAWFNIDFMDVMANPLYEAKELYINGEPATDVVVPDGVKNIHAYGLSAKNIKRVKLPNSVTSIDNAAFYYCESLTSIEIPDSVTSIGNRAFGSCTSLTSIEIPDSVTSIDGGAFSWCESLEYVKLPRNITEIGSETFKHCISLESIEIPDSVTTIGSAAFKECYALKEFDIGSNVTKIDSSAFYDCGFTSITIPDKVKEIGTHAFDGCVYLKEITLGSGIEKIDSYAFYYCYRLESVNIKNLAAWCKVDVSEDYSNPFVYAKNLYINNKLVKDVVIPGNISEIGNDVLKISTVAFIIPKSVKKIGTYAFADDAEIFYAGTQKEWEGIYKKIDSINLTVHYNTKSNHNTVTPLIASTCSTAGVNLVSCSCGYSRNVSAPLSEHAYGDWIVTKEATCTQSGSRYKKCSICEVVSETDVVPAKEHKSSDWKVTKAATCTAEGTKQKECTVCKAVVETGKIEKTAHKSSDWKIDKKATTSAAGSKHKECTKCGKVLETAKIAQLKCSKPKLSKVENTADGVKITWGKVSGADSYDVYRKTGSGKYSKIATVKGNSKVTYTDKSAKSGKKYSYYVKAVNEAGSSEASKSKSIYYLADPTLKTPKSTKKGITLKWKKVTGADGYQVWRKTGSGSYSKIATVKGNSKVTYTDKSAKTGKTYTYKIKAYKSKTYSAYSNAKKIKDKY